MSRMSILLDHGHDFVFEPFTESIFGSWRNFESFLKKQGNILNDKKLIITIQSFYKEYKRNNYEHFSIPTEGLAKYAFIPEIKNVLEEQSKR